MGEAFLVRRGGVLGEFFGDGTDGALNTTGNITFPVPAHSGIVIKQYTSITINAGHTVTTDNPCRGLILYCLGDVVIDGTIDMSKKAGLAPNGEITPLVLTRKNSLGQATIDKFYKLTTILEALKGGTGGNGGHGGGGYSGGQGGSGRINAGGFGGGGGGGSAQYDSSSQLGGVGGSIKFAEIGLGGGNNGAAAGGGTTSDVWSGKPGRNGGGGSGAAVGWNPNGSGPGGICYGGGGGGSGGANYGSWYGSFAGGDGEHAGGCVLIVAKGNVSGTGAIKCNGGNGGNGSNAADGTGAYTSTGGGGGGGGAGGGVIAIFHRGTYSPISILEVNGGLGGSGGQGGVSGGEVGGSGTSGSIGTIHIQEI